MMIEYTRKNVNIDQEILELVSKSEKYRHTDIITNKRLLDRRSKSTLEKRISHLKEANILQKREDGTYSVNPYITDNSKDYKQQIKKGIKKEKEHTKILEASLFKETELRNRICKPEITTILKGFGELNDEVFTSNEANVFLGNIFYSFLREGIIFNPDLWKKLIKPAHFNFNFAIKCNWEKDPEIFNLINELKELYKKLGYIPHNNNSPFHKKETLKLNNEIDEHYNKAVSDEVIRNLIKKKVEKIEDNFKTTLINNYENCKKRVAAFEDFPILNEFDDIINIIQNSDKSRCPTIEERKEFSENFLSNIKKMTKKLEETI